jgi:hypothetical protein
VSRVCNDKKVFASVKTIEDASQLASAEAEIEPIWGSFETKDATTTTNERSRRDGDGGGDDDERARRRRVDWCVRERRRERRNAYELERWIVQSSDLIRLIIPTMRRDWRTNAQRD